MTDMAAVKAERGTVEQAPPAFESPQRQHDLGKALRDKVSRESHAEWKPHRSRRDAIDVLREADAERVQELIPIRYGRMLPSAFTFYRGSAAVMAADLASTPTTGMVVQSAGDCHLKNFGGFATPERNIVFDINDFDETLPAPWEWDVKRLVTSFVLAVRANGISDDGAREAALRCASSYRKGIRSFAKLNPLDLWYARMTAEDLIASIDDPDLKSLVEKRVKKASSSRGSDVDYPKLAEVVHGEVRIRESPPLIFHPEQTRAEGFRKAVDEVLGRYRDTLPDDRRVLFDRYRYVDAALKVVGVGSVGTFCWIVLFMSPANDPLFLQLKQAKKSVLEPYAGKSKYENSGQRVVVGQRLMQAASDIFLGWTTAPRGDFYVRQLRDAKISPLVEEFDQETFVLFAQACGSNLARAHAKSGNAYMLSGYLGKSEVFDESVVDFAFAYARQAERDHDALKTAVRAGKIDVYTE